MLEEVGPWVERHQRALLAALVLALLLAGIGLSADYGVSWDEPAERAYGHATLRYVLNGDTTLLTLPERVYGPAHEVFASIVEKAGQALGVADAARSRHFANFLVFALAVIPFYFLARRATASAVGGFIVGGCLILSPPLFAHAFYNGKDVPVLSWCVIAVSSLLGLTERPGVRTTLWHALSSAWLVCIRVVGLLVPALTLFAIAWCWLQARRDPERRRRLAVACAVYVLLFVALTILFWPALWPSPARNFADAVRMMSHFPWPGTVLYRGQSMPATDVPWHYAPTWMAITIPPAYLAAFGVGLLAILVHLARSARRTPLFHVLLVLWFALPLAAVIGLHSIVFDGWRHLFFIYPAMLLIGACGAAALLRAGRAWLTGATRAVFVGAALALLLLQWVATASFMVRAHPHEGTYFNALVGGVRGARFRYDLDYWGVSYRAGLESVVRRDQASRIPVFVSEPVGRWNAEALPIADRTRLVFVDSPGEAKYFLGTYRFQNGEYAYRRVFDQVLVDNVPILSVFLLR